MIETRMVQTVLIIVVKVWCQDWNLEKRLKKQFVNHCHFDIQVDYEQLLRVIHPDFDDSMSVTDWIFMFVMKNLILTLVSICWICTWYTINNITDINEHESYDCGEFDSAFDQNSAGTMVQHKSISLNLVDVPNGANDANDHMHTTIVTIIIVLILKRIRSAKKNINNSNN